MGTANGKSGVSGARMSDFADRMLARRDRQEIAAAYMEMFRAYDASTSSRLRKQAVKLFGSGDAINEPERGDLVALSRALDRNSAIYNGFIDQMATMIVGEGITPRGLNPAAERAVEKFLKWADRADDRGLSDFAEMQFLMLREYIVAGDFLAVKTSDRTVQIIESERIADRISAYAPDAEGVRVIDGVKIDGRGRPVAFMVRPWGMSAGGGGKPWGDPEEVEPRFAMFMANRKRPSETRGTPWLHAAFEAIAGHEDYLSATRVAATLAAIFALVIQTENALAAQNALADDGTQESVSADGTTTYNKLTAAAEGKVLFLGPGETASQIQGQHPQTKFAEYDEAVMRMLCLVAGYPYESLTMNLRNASYPVSRLAEQMGRATSGPARRALIARVLDPMFQWCRAFMILDGTLPDDPASAEIAWDEPARFSVDPLRDAQADTLEIQQLLTSRERVAQRRGNRSLAGLTEQQQREKAMLEEAGITPVLAPGAKVAPGDNAEEGSAGGKPSDGGEAPETRDAGGPSPR